MKPTPHTAIARPRWRKGVITHDTSSSPADIEPCRCGRTTLVTLVSRICMKATTMTVTVIAHFRAGEIGSAAAAGGVMLGCDRIGAGNREREGTVIHVYALCTGWIELDRASMLS